MKGGVGMTKVELVARELWKFWVPGQKWNEFLDEDWKSMYLTEANRIIKIVEGEK